jgi:hypothetical protein
MTGTDLGGYGAIEQYVNDIGSPLPMFKDHPPNSAIPEGLGGLVYLIDQGDGLEVWSRSRGEDPVRLGGGGSGGGGSSAWSENADGALEPKDGQPVSVDEASIGGGPTIFNSPSRVHIATKTVSGESNVQFDEIDNSFASYVISASDVRSSSDQDSLVARVSTDESTFDSGASDYEWGNQVVSSGGSTSTNGSDSDSKVELVPQVTDKSTDQITGNFTIAKPADGDVFTSLNAIGMRRVDSFNQPTGFYFGGGYRVASQTDESVRLFMDSGNITGRFVLHGVVG